MLTSKEKRLLGETGELRTDLYTALYSLSSILLLESSQVLGSGKGITGKERKVQRSLQCPPREHTAGVEAGMGEGGWALTHPQAQGAPKHLVTPLCK